MTFKQMVKEDDALTDCSNDGLCLGIIQMGSNFQIVSLVLPQESTPGDVPFIFSGIDDFIEYIENGLTSSSSIFLQFPTEFDYSNPEHMVHFKRSRQKSVKMNLNNLKQVNMWVHWASWALFWHEGSS